MTLVCISNLISLAGCLKIRCHSCPDCMLIWSSTCTRSKMAIYNHWTGLVDWTGGLDWWTDTKNHFYASNEIQMLIGLHDAPQNNLLLSLVPRPLPDFISQLWRKIRRRPGIRTAQNYVTDRIWWIRLVRNMD